MSKGHNMTNEESEKHLTHEQIELQERDWEMVGQLFLAATQLYRSDPTDIDYIQNRLGPGLAKVLNEAFPEFDGGVTLSIKPK